MTMEWPKSRSQRQIWGAASIANRQTASSTSRPGQNLPGFISDDELRRRILANACVLFPLNAPGDVNEIVYATRPRGDSSDDKRQYQYAMLIRRNAAGDHKPLTRGTAWTASQSSQSSIPTASCWNLVLQGLLDVTAEAVHKHFESSSVDGLLDEPLPLYEEGASS